MSQTSSLPVPVHIVIDGDNNRVIIEYDDGSQRFAPFLSPYQPPYQLVGRETLLGELKALLLKGDSPNVVALCGLPGIGKTALLIALAHDASFVKHFPDGVLWAGLGHHPNPFYRLEEWMIALGYSYDKIARYTTSEERRHCIRQILGNRRMLLIIDDAWMLEDAQWFQLGGPHCAHLVSTRKPDIALKFAGIKKRKTIHELSHDDGLKLLQELSQNIVKAEYESVKELVAAVDGLPLALVLIGKYLHEAGYDQDSERISSILERLKNEEERLKLRQAAGAFDQFPNLKEASISLFAAIEFTTAMLYDNARAALRRLSVFAPKPGHFSSVAAQDVTQQSSGEMTTLYRYGILEVSKKDRYTIHQTISDYAKLKLHENSEEAAVTYHRHSTYFAEFLKLCETKLKNELPKEPLQALGEEMPNLDLMWQRALAQKQDEIIRKASDGLEIFYWLRGSYTEGEEAFNQALEAFHESPEGREAKQSHALFLARLGLFHGRFLHALQQYDSAKERYEHALHVFQAELVHNDPNITVAMNDLGALYESRGDYRSAEALYRQSLTIRRGHFDEDHRSVIAGMDSLARLYHKQGRYKDAEREFQAYLKNQQDALGPTHPNVAMSLNSQAVLYRSQGKNQQAESCYQQALTIWRDNFGDTHPNIAIALNNLAELCHAQGRYLEARSYYQQTLMMQKKILGEERFEDHLDVAQTFNNLGGVCKSEKKYTEAKSYYLKAKAIRKKWLGLEHPKVATVLNNLAELYRAQGQYAKAESDLLQALKIQKNTLGAKHPDVATSLNNLALLFYTRKDFTEAEKSFLQALHIREESLGPEHPDVAQSLNNLAVLYSSMGKQNEVRTQCQRLLDVSRSLAQQARVHESQEEYADARACYVQSLRTAEYVLNFDHPYMQDLQQHIAEVEGKMGK